MPKKHVLTEVNSHMKTECPHVEVKINSHMNNDSHVI